MSTQHTPGPWYVYQHHPGAILHVVPCKEPTIRTVQICSADGWAHRPEVETRANFNLIAAAPELLEALKQCEQLQCFHTDNVSEEDATVLDTLRAALAKAKGTR